MQRHGLVHIALVSIATVLLSGCGVWERVVDRGAPSLPEDRAMPPAVADSTEMVDVAPDSIPGGEPEVDSPVPEPTVTPVEEDPVEPLDEVPDDAIVPPPPEEKAEAVSDTNLVDPDPPLRVRITDEERETLLERTRTDLEVASAVAAEQPDLSNAEPEVRQRWETLSHYITQATSFLEAQDLRAAADLAVKARVLAEELAPR